MTNLRIACLALAFIAFPLNASQADQVKGTATYLQRMALPPHALFDAHVEDVSRASLPLPFRTHTGSSRPSTVNRCSSLRSSVSRVLSSIRRICV